MSSHFANLTAHLKIVEQTNKKSKRKKERRKKINKLKNNLKTKDERKKSLTRWALWSNHVI